MTTTRRLMILGAAVLSGAAQAANARPQHPSASPRAGATPAALADLLAAGRRALASSEREG